MIAMQWVAFHRNPVQYDSISYIERPQFDMSRNGRLFLFTIKFTLFNAIKILYSVILFTHYNHIESEVGLV